MAFTSRSAQTARGSFCLQLTSQCSAGCVTRSLGSIRPVQSTVLHQRRSFTRAEAETLSCSLPGLHCRQSHAAISPAAAAGKAGSKNESRHSVRQPAYTASPLLSNGSSLHHNHSARRMHSAVVVPHYSRKQPRGTNSSLHSATTNIRHSKRSHHSKCGSLFWPGLGFIPYPGQGHLQLSICCAKIIQTFRVQCPAEHLRAVLCCSRGHPW